MQNSLSKIWKRTTDIKWNVGKINGHWKFYEESKGFKALVVSI